MSSLDSGRAPTTGLDSEASRLRLRLLETFWASSALEARERRARLEEALRESVSMLDPQVRERVVERALQGLALWAPAGEAAPAAGGGALRQALVAVLSGEPLTGLSLSADDQRIVECVRALVDHLSRESQNHIALLRDVVRGETTLLPVAFLQALRESFRKPAGSAPDKEIERLREVLRNLEITRNLLFGGARTAAGTALARLVADLDPARAGGAKGGARKGWEEYERLYEEVAALLPEDLRDRYFMDAYKKELKKGAQV